MSYAIFRVEPINKLHDLGQIGAHNKRKKEAYQSNPDIIKEQSINNIEIVPCLSNYHSSYMNLVKDYKKQHNDKQKTIRESRRKSFSQMLDDSNSVVADEMLFTSDTTFFKDMNNTEIEQWANTCMEFVYQDIGYQKEQVLHATVHMDEKTPHIHCIVVPLIKKFDKRSKEEKFTISKKHYMKDRNHLSLLQDKYHKRMVDNGYNLDRGIKNSDNEHIDIKQYKKITRKLNHELTIKNEQLNNAYQQLEENMITNKEMVFDKEHIKIKKETFDSMNQVIKESKKVMELQPKIQQVYNEVDTYAKSYRNLEQENHNIKREVKTLKYQNQQLEKENRNLMEYIKELFQALKHYFRYLLQIGNDKTKDITTSQIKDFYDHEEYKQHDVYDIAVDTIKEDELFEYVDINKNYDKDNFDIGM